MAEKGSKAMRAAAQIRPVGLKADATGAENAARIR